MGECAGTLVGEEDQLGQGHRQEPVLPPSAGAGVSTRRRSPPCSAAPPACRAVRASSAPGSRSPRPACPGRRPSPPPRRIGRASAPSVRRDPSRTPSRRRPSWPIPGESSTEIPTSRPPVSPYPVGDDLHQPGIGSAPHQGVAALADELGELAGRPGVALVEVGGGEKNTNVHIGRSLSAGIGASGSVIDDRQDARRGVEGFEGSSGGNVDVHAWRRGKFPLVVGAGPVEQAVAEDDAVRREHGFLE